MNMMTAPIYHQNLVTFNNANLSIVDYNGQPYVPMKPIVEGMGLAWQGQYDKLKQRFSSVIMEIMTTGKDGKTYKMVCLPLKKLFGWMMTISPNKVKSEIKENIIKYQEECDDVLWNYWSGKLNARRKAFDELNEIDMDDKFSKGRATFHSLGMHQRKREKKINEHKRLNWVAKHVGQLDFGAKS